VELGKGGGFQDTLNVTDALDCPLDCPLKGGGNGKFRCIKHNGSATVVITGGVTRLTLSDFKSSAPCMTGKR
jgi:hypothetical protein